MDDRPVIHRAKWLIPVEGEPVEDGEVVVERGHIAEVRPARRGKALDYGNAAILPAFVNAHCHLEYTQFRCRVKERSFVPWLRSVYQLKRSVPPSAFEKSALRGAVLNARSGIGTIGDFSDAPVSAKALAALGLRGVVYQELIAPGEDSSWEERLRRCRVMASQQRKVAGDHVEVFLAPHAPYTVCEQALRRFSRGRTAIHCAESLQEVSMLLEGKGELVEWFRELGIATRTPNKTPVTYLQGLGLLRPNVQLVHCVHATCDEIRLIADGGCSVVHCPTSNMKLNVGTAPIYELLREGVNVALGTDSLLSNVAFDMFAEMRAAERANRSRGKPPLTPRQLLSMATTNGARALGLERVCGALRPGLCADMCILSLETFSRADSIEKAIVSYGTPERILAMYVSGIPINI